MNNYERLEGMVAATFTPMDENGDVNLSVIEKYAELFDIKSNTIMFFSDVADEKKLTTPKLLLKILETRVD